MTATTAEQMRAWRGPAILTYGFRPFFFGAAVWAALAMVLWVPMLSGHLILPTAFDPVSWHAHEFLFGYLGAVIAGFLLTAVPNWTGRLPIVGWRLGILALVWLAGRVAVAVSAGLPAGLVAIADLAFPVLFALAMLREIVAGRNWRNLIVLAMLAVFIAGNALFPLGSRAGRLCRAGIRSEAGPWGRRHDDRRHRRSDRALLHPQLAGETAQRCPARAADAGVRQGGAGRAARGACSLGRIAACTRRRAWRLRCPVCCMSCA
jgi:hypothetical protein